MSAAASESASAPKDEEPLDEMLRRRHRNFGMQNSGNGGARHGLNVSAAEWLGVPHSGRDFLEGRATETSVRIR